MLKVTLDSLSPVLTAVLFREPTGIAGRSDKVLVVSREIVTHVFLLLSFWVRSLPFGRHKHPYYRKGKELLLFNLSGGDVVRQAITHAITCKKFHGSSPLITSFVNVVLSGLKGRKHRVYPRAIRIGVRRECLYDIHLHTKSSKLTGG
jgi:hypothetical protein